MTHLPRFAPRWRRPTGREVPAWAERAAVAVLLLGTWLRERRSSRPRRKDAPR